MTLKSTSSPLDQMLLTEWRTQVCGVKGIDYDSQATAWQTMFNDTVNRAFEYLSQRAAHHPWGQQETTLTVLSGTDSLYSMPAAFRNIVSVYEVSADGTVLNGVAFPGPEGKRSFFEAKGRNAGWESSSTPRWFFDGLTSDQPPVQQWRRVGIANAGATAYVLFHPYFNILSTSGQDAYPYLPAAESSALLHRILSQLAAAEKDWQGAQFHKGLMEDEIAALEIADRQTVDAPLRMGTDPDFERQM